MLPACRLVSPLPGFNSVIEKYDAPAMGLIIRTACVLVLCLPPMVILLGHAGPRHHMEGLALLTAQETWMRQASGEPNAWLIPTQNGEVRVRKPPMFVWLNMLAWTGLDHRTATAGQIIFRARLISAAMALVMIASTWWIACSLRREEGIPREDSHQFGFAAALIAGSMILVQEQARTASYDVHVAAWGTLSAAAAIWAMRPPHSGSRKPIGWLIAALALALAWMSKGPVALAIAGIPVAALIACEPVQRVRRAIWFAGSAVLALLLVAPWYAFLLQREPEAWNTLLHEYGASLTNEHGLHYYPLQLLKLSFPWTIWLLGGLALPFAVKDRRQRERLLVPWVWFVAMLIAFSILPGKATRYILPIAVPTALLAAAMWREHGRKLQERRTDRGDDWLRRIHWIVLLCATAAFGTMLLGQDSFVERGWISPPRVLANKSSVIAATHVLIILALAGAMLHARRRWIGAIIATAGWLCCASSIYTIAQADPIPESELAGAEAGRVHSVVGPAPLAYLVEGEMNKPDYDFLFYLRRIVPPVRARELADLGQKLDVHEAAFVMTQDSEKNAQRLQDAEYERILEFQDSPRHDRALWRRRYHRDP